MGGQRPQESDVARLKFIASLGRLFYLITGVTPVEIIERMSVKNLTRGWGRCKI